jgi:hypothetical protein
LMGGFGNFFVPLLIGAVSLLKSNNNYNYYNTFSTNVLCNNNINSYLAGLFEGNGQIIMNKGNNQSKKRITKIRKVTLSITFNIKDLPLCRYIKSQLKSNRIIIINEKNTCVLIFHTDKSIINFVNKVNGYLRSPKIYKFNKVIDYLNNKYSLNIIKYKEDISDFNNNNWLGGFIDADGVFYIRYTNTIKFRIVCNLILEQRMIDPISKLSYKPLLLSISEFLKVKLKISKHNSKSYFLIRANNNNSLNIILNYFNIFNMYSSKYLDYQNWAIVARLLLNKTAYYLENRNYIYSLKNSMNKKRTYFNWDHLKYL